MMQSESCISLYFIKEYKEDSIESVAFESTKTNPIIIFFLEMKYSYAIIFILRTSTFVKKVGFFSLRTNVGTF